MDEVRLYDLESRLSSHEARCEERDKTMFNRLDKIEHNINKLAYILLTSMAGLIITLLMQR